MSASRYSKFVTVFMLVSCGSSPTSQVIRIPNGQAGIGFDDLRYSPSLQRVLVPSGRTGTIALIALDNSVELIKGFGATGHYDGGHDAGVTSVDEGRGWLFATDRTKQILHVINATSKSLVASRRLSSSPDYVRYVTSTKELWVTEPGAEQIEILSLSTDALPEVTHAAVISISNGPESLVIDAARARAYTHRWQASTVAIDIHSRAIIGEWPNACAASRGIDVDPKTGYVLVACNEGTASVLDPSQGGKIISKLSKGSGYDVVGFNRTLRHLYLAGGACSCLTILGVSASGQLSFLGRTDAPNDTHCVTADANGNAWLCDPGSGSVLRVHDPYASTQ